MDGCLTNTEYWLQLSYKSWRTCITDYMGSISCHIMPLVIDSFSVDTQTHIHTDTYTQIYTYIYIYTDTCRDTDRLTQTETDTLIHKHTHHKQNQFLESRWAPARVFRLLTNIELLHWRRKLLKVRGPLC